MPDHAEPLERLLEALEICLAPEALLFDLDGVIADVEESYRRCVLETAGTFGVEVTREELATEVLAGDANNDWVLTQRIMAGQGVDVRRSMTSQRRTRRCTSAHRPHRGFGNPNASW